MDAIALEDNSPKTPTVPGRQLEDLPRVAKALAALVVVAALLVMVMLMAEAMAAGAPHMGLEKSWWWRRSQRPRPRRQPRHRRLTRRLRCPPQN
jgi:hypothetical protein